MGHVFYPLCKTMRNASNFTHNHRGLSRCHEYEITPSLHDMMPHANYLNKIISGNL